MCSKHLRSFFCMCFAIAPTPSLNRLIFLSVNCLSQKSIDNNQKDLFLEKLIKWTSSKFKTSTLQKATLRKWKEVTDWEKIFAIIFNKGFLSRIYRAFLQLSNKMIVQSKHRRKIWNRHFFKEYIQMVNKHRNRCLTLLIIRRTQIKP